MLLVSLMVPLHAQQPPAWKDPSPHITQFVAVDKSVRLEVLAWGGSGRPLVLLATTSVFFSGISRLTISLAARKLVAQGRLIARIGIE